MFVRENDLEEPPETTSTINNMKHNEIVSHAEILPNHNILKAYFSKKYVVFLLSQYILFQKIKRT